MTTCAIVITEAGGVGHYSAVSVTADRALRAAMLQLAHRGEIPDWSWYAMFDERRAA